MKPFMTFFCCLFILMALNCSKKEAEQRSSTVKEEGSHTAMQLPKEGDEMESVQLGSVVLVDYVGTLDNGDMFDTSVKEEAEKANIYNAQRNYTPLRVVVGQKQVIPGFEEALMGMKVGDSKTVALSPEKAYGQVNENLIQKVPIDMFKKSGMQPEVGTMVQFQSRDGRPVSALIQEVKEDSVLVDMNHPLAGKTLNFKLTVNQIQ